MRVSIRQGFHLAASVVTHHLDRFAGLVVEKVFGDDGDAIVQDHVLELG